MPNWATGSMTLVLPTKNADKFLSFIERNEDKHFYRTTFTENEAPANNSHGLTKLSFNVECAWSAENCLVNPDADAEDCIPFEELCKQLKVQRLSARFEEHGLMFGETLYYDMKMPHRLSTHTTTETVLFKRHCNLPISSRIFITPNKLSVS